LDGGEMMYKLLIVDDEANTRYGLMDYFEWEKYGIEVVGEADNGNTAMPKIIDLKPHIVLTDVKMAKMDGIALARWIKNQYKNIKIIFISGYDDAQYLRSALKVEAVDYILKPINFQELGKVVEDVVEKLQEEEKQNELIYQMNIKLMQSMPLLKEKFLMTLISDNIENINEIEEKIKFLDLKLTINALYCAVVINVDDKVILLEDKTEKDRQLISFSVINICQEIIDNYTGGYIFEYKSGEYVSILKLNSQEDEEKLFILVTEIKDSLLRYLKLSVTIGVGKTVEQLKKVYKSYAMACEAISQRLFLGKNKVITIDSIEENEDIINRNIIKEDNFVSIIRSGDESRLLEFIHQTFLEMKKNRRLKINYCHNLCLHMVLIASRVLMELDISMGEMSYYDSTICNQIYKCEILEDMKKVLEGYFKEVSRLIYAKRSRKANNVIERIRNIINERYKDNITVNEIAKEVYLTSTYICLIYKQETGETINDYVIKVRMEKAKTMLKDYKNKLYDISYAVGYTDPSYFSKTFKKYTGYSPTEYREKII
jgi:two-component system response regulator YesN